MTGVQTCALPICDESSGFNCESCGWRGDACSYRYILQVCLMDETTTAYATAYDIILSVKTICLGSLILGIGTPLSRPSFMGMACGLYWGRSLESSVS